MFNDPGDQNIKSAVEDTVSECDEDCEFTSDNAILYTTNITSAEVTRPRDTTEHSTSVGVTNSPGRVQINLNKPSPRVNESDFEPIIPTEEIIISDEVTGVTVRTNDGVMVTNPNVAIEIKFPGKKPTEDTENVSVKFSFGDEDEKENEIDDSLIDNSGLYDVVTSPVISTTTEFVPPNFDSLPVFEKDIFTTTEAVYNGILTPEETTGKKIVENKLPTAAETTRPEIIKFTTLRPGTMTVNTSSQVTEGNLLINSDSVDDLEDKNIIEDIQRPAMPRFDEIGSPTENGAYSTSTASTLIIESTSKTAKTDVESVITSQGDKDASISQASSTSRTEEVLSTSSNEEVLLTSSTGNVLSTSTLRTEEILSTSTSSTQEVLSTSLISTNVLSSTSTSRTEAEYSTSTTKELSSTSKSTSKTEEVSSTSGNNVLSTSASSTTVLSSSTSRTEEVLSTSTSRTAEVLSTSRTEEVLSTSTSNTEEVLKSKETSSATGSDMQPKLDENENTSVMTEATNSDFVTDDMNSSNQSPEGIETAITGSDGEKPKQPEQTDISTSSAINEIFTLKTPTISSTDKPIKSQTSTSITIEQSSPAESHETLSSPEIMSSTEPTKNTITTFPSSAVKIPVVATEEQQAGPVISSALPTQQPTTKNISINDLTSESTEASPFEIEQTTKTRLEQAGLGLTTEMNRDRESSHSEVPSVTTTNTIIGGESVSSLPSEISSAPDPTKEKEKTLTDVIAGAEERSPDRNGTGDGEGVSQREDMSDQTSSEGVGGKVLVTTVSYGLENTMSTPTSSLGQTNQERENSTGSSTSSSATTLTSIRERPSPTARPRTDDVTTTRSSGSYPSSRTESAVPSSVSRLPSPPQPRLDDGLVPGNELILSSLSYSV